jgi:DNA sulfur modification protein DndD
MLLEQVILHDVGTYRGLHSFDLLPRIKYGAKRPIVLFGGLNGSGKTTFLAAVRLCLYGRQALEVAPTQREYSDYLDGLVHRTADVLAQPGGASVSLSFTYSRLGQVSKYRLGRTWKKKGSKTEETLHLYKDDAEAPFLSNEQAQAFVSALIPSGVSAFFFFDGERISDFARDDDDFILTDAIRRLMGLDIADRLSSDLTSFVRARRGKGQESVSSAELGRLQKEYDQIINSVDSIQNNIATVIQPKLDEAIAFRERVKSELSDRGGAWTINRADIEGELGEIVTRRLQIEDHVRELMAGPGLFAFSPTLSAAVASTVSEEQKLLDFERAGSVIKSEIAALKSQLEKVQGSAGWRGVANRCIDQWLEGLRPNGAHKPVHGVSGTEAVKLIDVLVHKQQAARKELEHNMVLISQLGESEVDRQNKLRQAPPEVMVRDAFAEFQQASEKAAELQVQRKLALEDVRHKLWSAIVVSRKKKKLELAMRESSVEDQATRLASDIQDLLVGYKAKAAIQKCQSLRENFLIAHRKLARKEDSVCDAAIDPNTFALTLYGKHGEVIPKKSLSAGEKQIFAIAMLEALGKTSGRNLPVIIDTPLGRLDSKHREKLVGKYFPTASHQVIVLSTDTEVDERFYDGLRPMLSHAYHLKFDPNEQCTTVEAGYFWKKTGGQNAS